MKTKQHQSGTALVEHIQEQDRKMIELAKTNGRLERELELAKKGKTRYLDANSQES